MRVPTPLPEALLGREFSRVEAEALGVPLHRLRARDLERVGKNVFREKGTCGSLPERAAALATANPRAWISHQTAATIHCLWLPASMADSAGLVGPPDRTSGDLENLHLSKPHRLAEVRQPGVVGHSVRILPGEVAVYKGIRMTTPARTWLDLACRLTLEDLVVIGDQLLRNPRPQFEDRTEPWATRTGIREMLAGHPNLQGIVRAREALELMRMGADSAPETKLRLALLELGLPEPELQVKVHPNDPWSPPADLGYRRARIAIQYDGGIHLTSEQQSRDNRRDEAFNSARWTYFKFNRNDLRDGFRFAALRVRRAMP